MGYNLYITRKEYAHDEEGEKISHKEWIDYVTKTPELIIDKKSPDYVIFKNSNDSDPWLYWSESGVIDSKNPSHSFIEKMIPIATDLGARVQGDDGEIYTTIPEGFKLISDHQPPKVVEYHRKNTNGKNEYIEVVVSKNEPETT